METYAHDIIVAMIAWVIPLIGGWLLAKLPRVRNLVMQHPTFTTIGLSGIISVLVATTVVVVYDKQVGAELNELRNQIATTKQNTSQLASVTTSLSASTQRGTILASGFIKNKQLIYSSAHLSFDSGTGKVSFPNPSSLKFIPIVANVSANDQSLTETCFTKGIGSDYFVLWAGGQDVTGHNNSPQNCSFTVVTVGD